MNSKTSDKNSNFADEIQKIDWAITLLIGSEDQLNHNAASDAWVALEEIKKVLGNIGKPVCPLCREKMEPRYFSGYYAQFPMWECGCSGEEPQWQKVKKEDSFGDM
jgi:hypothetical protein